MTVLAASLPPAVGYAAVAMFGLGMLGLVWALVAPGSDRELTAEERVQQYGSANGHAATSSTDTFDSAKAAARELLDRNQGLDVKITRRLEGAGSSLKPPEWLLIHGGLFLLILFLGAVIGHGNVPLILIFGIFGVIGPWFYLGFRRSRRVKAFNSQLPDSLQLMSGALSAGLSLAQSVDTIVREGNEPIASEFRRVLVETRLGVGLEDAMDSVSDRFESKDFAWVVMAIRIQRQVGGNLAELLNTVAATMREREYMRRQVAALSAEGRLSAMILGGLPPAFMLFLLATNYDFVKPLFTEPIGIAMLIGAAVLLTVGIFWMSRLVKVEV